MSIIDSLQQAKPRIRWATPLIYACIFVSLLFAGLFLQIQSLFSESRGKPPAFFMRWMSSLARKV